MPSLRDEITKSLRWFNRRDPRRAPHDLGETWIRPGTREGKDFGQYRIAKHLGSGGMGDVYLALDTRLGRNVALKFLPAELTSNQEILRRFQDEARTASALNHPNILTIYDIGEIEGEHFIASEYIEGITLREALNNHEVDLTRALHIATQVASALAEAHYAGIVHRDLKPGNIMLRRRDDYVKIIDFGLAKLLEAPVEASSLDSRTVPGVLLGTVHYMSPEQARGLEVDPRSDLWSLGVILYEMVAQKRPFDGDTESHVIVAILDHPVAPLRDERTVPPQLTAILQRALAKDRAKRYQSAQEMHHDLVQVLPRADSAIVIPRPKPVRRPPRAPSVRVPAVVLGGLALCFAIWWWPLGGRDWVAPPDWFQIGSTQRATFDGNVRLAALSTNGAYLAYITGYGADELLHTRQMPWGLETRVPLTNNHCIGLTFSPGNQSLYYVLKNPQEEFGRAYRMKLPSGIPGLLLENIDSAIAFSPDGSQFAFTRRTEERSASSVSILVGSTREPTDARPIVTKHNVEIIPKLAWSPRGDEIAAIFFPAQLDKPTKPAIYLFSLDGREKAQIPATHLRNLRSAVWLDGGASIMASGLAEGAEQRHLEQLYIRTRQFHELPSAIGYDSISTTRDNRTLAAVSREERSSIWIADATSLQKERRLVPQTESIETLAWSADGSIIFPSARSGNVNLVRAAQDGGVHELGTGEPCVEREPASIPGAAAIIYSSNCANGGDDFNLWRLDLDTGRRTQLTSGSNFDDQPDVSADGKWILYTSWPSNNPSIWRMRTDGGIPVRLMAKQARRPFVSPDGKQIVCQIREITGPWHVAIAAFDTGEIVKEFPQIPISFDSAPVPWSPDGSALDYIASEGASSNLWRQPLNGEPPRRLTAAGEDNLIYFAWNSDGTQLAYIRGRVDSDVMIFRRAAQK